MVKQPNIFNLKALMSNKYDLTIHQKAQAIKEFANLIEYVRWLEDNQKEMTDKEKARLEFANNSVELRPYNNIHSSAFIDRTAIIGKDGFGFARDIDGTLVKVNHAGNVIIEKDVEIRAFVTVDRAVNHSTIIGEGTKIDHHCHIAHNVKIGKWNTLANGCVIEDSCEVGHYNTFGAGVIVQRKVKIGSNCKFGSGTVVIKNVPDGEIWVGNPARKLENPGGYFIPPDFVEILNSVIKDDKNYPIPSKDDWENGIKIKTE